MGDSVVAPAYLSLAAAGEVYGLSRSALSRLLAAGHVRAVKAGARTLVDSASIASYFASLPPVQYRQRHAA